MRTNNCKVQGNVFILKTISEQVCMHKISKQGHVIHIMSILKVIFLLSFKTTLFLCLFFLLFSLFNFDFTIYF